MVKQPFRTKTLSTKVSEQEFTKLEAAASKEGLTLSEWCRTALLASLNGQEPGAITDSAGTGQVALLAELLAVREILLNVLFRQANGKSLTAPEMQGLIDRADSGKLKKALERLAKASEPEMQLEGKS